MAGLKLKLRRRWRRGVYRASRVVAAALARSGPRGLDVAAGVAREAMYWLRPDLTRRDLANLASALPERPAPERRRILRASLAATARTSLEFLQLVDGAVPMHSLIRNLQAEGLERLNGALAAGRGVVAVSTHLGNFTVVPLWLAAHGYPVSVVIREAKHVPRGLYAPALARFNCEAILADDTRHVARAVLTALRRGGVVLLYLDQGVKRSGAMVEFLGRRVPMPEGPVVFARRSGAPVVPCLLDPDHARLRVLPALDFAAGAEAGESTAQQAQTLADIAAREIRAHPQHWQWRHRRWARQGTP